MSCNPLTSRRPGTLAGPFFALASCVLAGLVGAGAHADTWTSGHGDIGVAYPGTGEEFEMEVHIGAGAVVSGSTLAADLVLAPEDATIVVPTAANLKVISTGSGQWAGDNAGYDFVTTGSSLGVAPGGNLWVLSFNESDADFYGTPFLGWATEEGFLGEPFGNVTFTPYSFSSPIGGSMGIFEDDLTPLWILRAGDSSFTGDEFEVPADAHVHRVLAFTQPGLYEVGIRATALLDGTTTVIGEGVYQFQVVPEPSGILLAGAGALGALLAARRRRVGRGRRD
jgi:surface-anchored protein